jgi:hypothetical protein
LALASVIAAPSPEQAEAFSAHWAAFSALQVAPATCVTFAAPLSAQHPSPLSAT